MLLSEPVNRIQQQQGMKGGLGLIAVTRPDSKIQNDQRPFFFFFRASKMAKSDEVRN